MTRKTSAKLQRPRVKKRVARKVRSPEMEARIQRHFREVSRMLPDIPFGYPDATGNGEPSSQKSPATAHRDRLSARCAITAAAFARGTTGAVRLQLKQAAALAVVVLVPDPSWIDPLKKLFLARFGDRWQVVAGSATVTTPQQKAERNNEVSLYLSHGKPVVGFATHRDGVPSALLAAVDLTIRIVTPDGATIAQAIRMFTGERPANALPDKTGSGLEFHDLLSAFRKNSHPSEIVERLQKAQRAQRGATPQERLPALEHAVEYGAAQTWGLALARDISDYRAGKLDWQEVDRGAVLHSEPGLGKSLYARILAEACGIPLVAFSIADLFAKSSGYLDSVIKACRAMFETAAARAPCILFLDEIDALPNRATMSARGADWWTPVITDFLLNLDSAVAGQRAGIVVVGATNNIAGVDAAILRPGRLERAIEVTRPDHAGILNILRHHLNGSLADADLTDIGHLMAGSTPAQIMMSARSARRAARYAGRELELDDIFNSVAPAEDIPPEALLRISTHEAAHAVGSLAVPSGILQRCIIGGPAGTAGLTVFKSELDDLPTKDAVERRAVVTLCGRAAEELLIGSVGLGSGGDPGSDLAAVTQHIACLHASTGLGGTLAYLTSYEDALQAVRADRDLRARVEAHMRALQNRANEVVRQNRDAIIAVAEQLSIRRHLSGDEIRRLFEANTPPAPPALAATNH